MHLSIANVTPNGIEAVMPSLAPGAVELGGLVGSPVELARKVIGKVARYFHDPCGAEVVTISVSDPNALHLAETGCLTAVELGRGAVTLVDRPSDLGKTFQVLSGTGERLAKHFVGMAEHDLLAKHFSKLPEPIWKSANESFAELLVKGTSLAPVSMRRPGGSDRERAQRGATWPNSTPSIGSAKVVIRNRNANV